MASVATQSRWPIGLLWGGQSLSLLMSGASTISLSVWLFHATGDALDLGLLVAAKSAVSIYASPLVGSLSDTANRRWVIVASNVGLGATAVLMLACVSQTDPPLVPIVAVVLVSGLLESTLLVTLAASVKELAGGADLTRTNGIIGFLEASPLVAAPLLRVALSGAFGIGLVYTLDAGTFVVAALLAGLTPWRPQTPVRPKARSRVPFSGATDGLRLIWRDADFLRLQIAFSIDNVATGLAVAGVTAFVLTGPSGGAGVLGAFNAAGAVGLLAGSAFVAAVGPRLSRSRAVGLGIALAGAGGRLALGAGTIPPIWVVSSFVRSFGIQLTNAPLTAIWQEATPVEHQGKVFGARRLLGQGLYPVAVLAGAAVAQAASGTRLASGLWIAGLGCVEIGVALYLVRSGTLGRVSSHSRRLVGRDL